LEKIMAMIQKFEDIQAWQEARTLVKNGLSTDE
jgi:hypothetical protein